MTLLFKTDKLIEDVFKLQLSYPERTLERTECDICDMLKYLPNSVQNIIDLGCGSGRVSIGLNQKLNNDKITYWLVDGDKSTLTKYWLRYELDGKSRFYNQRKITKHFCDLNNMTNYKYITIDDQLNWSELPPLSEVLISKYSIGWHFPIRTYSRIYPKILKPGAICFFTCTQQELQNLPKYFRKVNIFRDSFPVHHRQTAVLKFNEESE